MSFQPYDRKPSGIVYFGTNSSDSLYESDASFTIGGGYLSASSIKLQNNGTIGSQSTPNAITIASDGAVSIYGNLVVNGTTTTVNSTTITVEDPIMILGSGSPSSDDNKDRGIAFNYYDGAARLGFFGFDDSLNKFIFVTGATITSEVVSGTKATIVADLDGGASSLTNGRYIQLNNQLTGSGIFNGTSDLIIQTALTADAITDQTESTTAYNDHYILIASGSALRKITKANFVADLGGGSMSSFNISDGSTSQQIDNAETVLFVDSDTIDFSVLATNSVSGVVKNNSINEFKLTSSVAGSGLIGGNGSPLIIGEGSLIDVAEDSISVDLTEAASATIAHGDYLIFLDGGISGTAAKGNTSGLATMLAGSGLVATDSTLHVIGGDGILVGGDEVEVRVDNSTIELSASDGTGSVRIKDGGVTEVKRTRTVETITSSKTIDKDITLVNSTTGSVTASLPENATAGKVVVIKRIDSSANNVIVSRTGSDTIDGSTEYRLYHIYETLTVVSDGSNWYII
jgi:hypothetical protein